MPASFKDRRIDGDAPIRCGQCIFHKHWKMFDKPCSELGVNGHDRICTEFVAATPVTTIVERRLLIEALRLINTAGLNAGHIQALLYGASKNDKFGRTVYIETTKNNFFQAIELGEKKNKKIVMHTGTGSISIVEASTVTTKKPDNISLSAESIVNKQEGSFKVPGQRGRPRGGAQQQTDGIGADIMRTVSESLSGESTQDEDATDDLLEDTFDE
jgi:hypothetical protein